MDPGTLLRAYELRSKTLNLDDYGWNQHFSNLFDTFECPESHPARVTHADRGELSVAGEAGVCRASLAGRLDHRGEPEPAAVGDWVVLDRAQDTPVVRAILPRRTELSRRRAGAGTSGQVVAANVDLVMVVEALDRGPNPRRLERAVAVAFGGGATPVIVLSKADLCSDRDAAMARARAAAPFSDVIFVSAPTGEGLSSLVDLTRSGASAVLLGPSGAGKSTIANHLLGEEHLATGVVRKGDSKGRHTTTRSELVRLPAGGCLIDTPGVRELGLWLDADSLGEAYADIEDLASECRFRDCSHNEEPGCAVQEAVRRGELDAFRLAGFHKLHREAVVAEQRKDVAKSRARDRQFAKLVRAHKKIKGSR